MKNESISDKHRGIRSDQGERERVQEQENEQKTSDPDAAIRRVQSIRNSKGIWDENKQHKPVMPSIPGTRDREVHAKQVHIP